MLKLGKRLTTIADVLVPGDVLADVGTDHGYLLVHLVQSGVFHKGIGAELNRGPYESALTTISNENLTEKIQIRLGDGLQKIEKDEVDTVVIAGMGGYTITNILSESKDKLSALKQMVLQPQSSPYRVRQKLNELGFRIEDEKLVKEDGRIYIIIYAKPGQETLDTWEKIQIGPKLLEKGSVYLVEYISELIKEREKILKLVNKAKERPIGKIEQIEDELIKLKELLNECESEGNN